MQESFKIKQIIDTSLEPAVAFRKEGFEVVYVNDAIKSLFNLNDMDGDLRLRHFCSRADIFNERSAVEMFSKLELDSPVIYDWPVRLNEIRWLSAYIRLLSVEDETYIIVVFRNNTKAKESLQRLDKMVAFREVLDQLLIYNTNINVVEIPSLIDQALELVGKFFDCDRSYVFEYSDDLYFKSNINEWCAPDVIPYIDELQDLPTNAFPYLKEKLFKLEVVCFDDIYDLPDNAIEEREEFAKEGIQSILMIPFSEGKKPLGFIGLDHVHLKKHWSKGEVSNLKLLARSFANFIVRMRNEKQIIDSKLLYETLFEAANDGIAIIKKGRLIDVNPKGLIEMRCSKELIIGKTAVELSAISQPDGKSTSYTNVYLSEAEKGIPQKFDWRLRRFDGTEFLAQITLNQFQIKNEKLVIAIFRDISRHQLTVDNLISNQENLKKEIESFVHPFEDVTQITLLNVFDIEQLQNVQDAFSYATGISSIITDTKGNPITKISFTNPVCSLVRDTEEGSQMCIKSGKELGEMASKQLKPVSRPCLACGFIDAASPIIVDGHHIGNWVIGQVRPKDLDIDRLLEYTRSLQLPDSEVVESFKELTQLAPEHFDKILNLLNVLTIELSDLGYNNLKLAKTINEHLKMERELRNAKQNAEESDRLKTAFLANLSHEIRTPMNGIVGFSELLQYDGLTPDDRREYVRLIHQSSSQLLSIINDIIDISKIEAGQMEVRARYFDLTRLGVELYSFFQEEADKKEIELIFENAEQGEFELFSDEVKLRQVLTNLISNAIKFTSEGSVRFGFIDINEMELELFVQDSGVGIDADDLEFIFDRFWQAKDTDVKKGGTGLGLAITKAYIELLGGHIFVESDSENGTRFSCRVPKSIK